MEASPGEGSRGARLDVHAGCVDDAAQERQEQLLQLPLHEVREHVPPGASRPRVLLVHLCGSGAALDSDAGFGLFTVSCMLLHQDVK